MRKDIVLELPSRILSGVVAIALLLMALLTATDVIGRYIFNSPVSGTDELIAAGMAVLIFGSLPLVAWRGEQITVDIFTGLFRGAAKRVQTVVVNIVGAVVLGYLALQLYALAGKMVRNADYSSLLHLPYAPLAYVMAALTAIAAAITLVLAFLPPPSRSMELAGE